MTIGEATPISPRAANNDAEENRHEVVNSNLDPYSNAALVLQGETNFSPTSEISIASPTSPPPVPQKLTVNQLINMVGFGWFQYKLLVICGLGWAADNYVRSALLIYYYYYFFLLFAKQIRSVKYFNSKNYFSPRWEKNKQTNKFNPPVRTSSF